MAGVGAQPRRKGDRVPVWSELGGIGKARPCLSTAQSTSPDHVRWFRAPALSWALSTLRFRNNRVNKKSGKGGGIDILPQLPGPWQGRVWGGSGDAGGTPRCPRLSTRSPFAARRLKSVGACFDRRRETDQIEVVGEHALALGAPELQIAGVVGADVGVGAGGGECQHQGRGRHRNAEGAHGDRVLRIRNDSAFFFNILGPGSLVAKAVPARGARASWHWWRG